jgi:hypothetical protein
MGCGNFQRTSQQDVNLLSNQCVFSEAVCCVGCRYTVSFLFDR